MGSSADADSQSGKFFQNSVRRDSEFLVRFSKALEDFANKRIIRGQAPPRELDDPLLFVLVSALENFVLAHEFAHLVLHHQKDDRLNPAKTSASPESILRSWGEEAIADVYAAELVNRLSVRRQHSEGAGSLRGQLTEFSRYAPVLFFRFNGIAEAARYVHDHAELPSEPTDAERTTVLQVLQLALTRMVSPAAVGSGNSLDETSIPREVLALGDHPPTWAREALMRAYWSDRMPTSVAPEEQAFRDMAVMMGRHLEVMWSDIGPLWVRIVNENKPPKLASEGVASGTRANGAQTPDPGQEKPKLLASKAWEEFSSGDYERALITSTKSIDAGYKGAHFIRGRIYLGLKDYRSAADDFTAQIAYSDAYYWSYANRAIAYWHLGETEKARADFDASLKRGGGQDASIRSHRGEFLLDVGDVVEGLAELRATAALAPDGAEFFAGLAEGLVYAEQYEDVAEVSELLRMIAGDYPEREAYHNLGLMYEVISLACAGGDFIPKHREFEETLKPSNIYWSFNLIDKWLSSAHCSDNAKAVAKQMIDRRRELIQ